MPKASASQGVLTFQLLQVPLPGETQCSAGFWWGPRGAWSPSLPSRWAPGDLVTSRRLDGLTLTTRGCALVLPI